jgi:hypothetical protein
MRAAAKMFYENPQDLHPIGRNANNPKSLELDRLLRKKPERTPGTYRRLGDS